MSAVRLAMEEVREGRRTNNDARRMCVEVVPHDSSDVVGEATKSKSSGKVRAVGPRTLDRFDISESGGFPGSCSCQIRRSRYFADTVDRRAGRALVSATMGELSSAWLALEGEAVASGDQATLGSLRDRRRRPPEPREPIPQEIPQTTGTLLLGFRWVLAQT